MFVGYLPENMQRTVSFLPGVEISGETAQNAQASINWRLGVWKYAAKRIPEYLLIGRGFVMDVSTAAWRQSSYYLSPEFAWMASNYHSGPLSVILTFGVPGVITFFGFFFSTVAYGGRQLKKYRQYQHQDAYTLLLFLTLLLCQKLFLYIFVMGEVRASFFNFMLWVVMIRWSAQFLEKSANEENLIAPFSGGEK